MPTALIVLAAGQGTRMKSDLPKVLHQVAGAPLLIHALNSGAALNPERTVVVIGKGGAEVEPVAKSFGRGIAIAQQEQQLGTAHAALQARDALEGFDGDVIVLYGDTPFIEGATLEQMLAARAEGASVVVLGFEAADPGRYGRLVTGEDGLEKIVEFAEATEAEKAITLCNSGVVCADADILIGLASAVGNDNAKGEYYLTEIVALARANGLKCAVVTCAEDETRGVDSREGLAAAEAAFQARARARAMDAGVTLIAPETVHFAHDTEIAHDVVIEPHVYFGPGVTIETGARINAYSHISDAHIAAGAAIGPFARLRQGAEIGAEAKIGNFVEVKNVLFGDGAKASHLTYLGDATIGAGTNIGAGTITCNYDGVSKHRTEIGKDVFIGSNSALVAPVKIGDEAMVAAGSVVTYDVPDEALALGRAQQVVKKGLAKRLMERLRAGKGQK